MQFQHVRILQAFVFAEVEHHAQIMQVTPQQVLLRLGCHLQSVALFAVLLEADEVFAGAAFLLAVTFFPVSFFIAIFQGLTVSKFGSDF